MNILIVTDAWAPQVNGVVRTLSTVKAELEKGGDTVTILHPALFQTIPCPSYPEIRLALTTTARLRTLIQQAQPHGIYIATEGPLGWLARHACLRLGLPFATGFHTRFPEYLHARTGLPVTFTYALLRHFHKPSSAILVPTPTVASNLEARGFHHIVRWSRGVDTALFKPSPPIPLNLPPPILLSVGRVAVEKNIEAFLSLGIPGSKVVVGDGPALEGLKKKYPAVHFAGAKSGTALTAYYNAADVFVFPSRTDTFGLVMLEALACGTPVAAYPVMGPIDVITDPAVGTLHEDLATAVTQALTKSRSTCRAFAETHSWATCAATFRRSLPAIHP